MIHKTDTKGKALHEFRCGIKLFDIHQARNLMAERNLQVVLPLSPENAYYVSGSYDACHYRFGFVRPVVPLIPREGDPLIIVNKQTSIDIKMGTWIKDIRTYENVFGSYGKRQAVDAIIDVLVEKGFSKGRIGIEEEAIPMSEYLRLSSRMPDIEWVDCGDLFDEMRMTKSAAEIQTLRMAAEATESAILEGWKATKAGESERMMAERLIINLVERGTDTTLYPVCFLQIGSGWRTSANAPVPSTKRMVNGELVLVDFGGKFSGYHSDLGGCMVIGAASNRQTRDYARLVSVHREVIESIRSGVKASRVFETFKASMKKRGFEMSQLPVADGTRIGQSGVGHGIGLSLHEEPVLCQANDRELRENMTVCVEIKVESEGGYMYIEDLVLVTQGGVKMLSEVQEHLYEAS